MKNYISKPYFLVGAERSGTTVLRLMLNYHPQITWCNEFEYAVDLIDDDQHWPDLDKYYDWLETHRIFHDSRFKIDKTLTYPELVNSFLHQRRIRDAKPLIGATVHRNFDQLLRIWPDARFIHIVRDGRDVARSRIGMGWDGHVWPAAKTWVQTEQLWDQFSRQLPDEHIFEVKYEDLISNYTETLENICQFIGVDYSPKMLDYVHHSDYSLPNPSLIQQWKKKQSKRNIQLIEAGVGDLLTDRGYELSGFEKVEVGIWTKAMIRLSDKWGRFQGRRSRLGLNLLVSDTVSRKLGLVTWQKQNLLKINDIQRQELKKST